MNTKPFPDSPKSNDHLEWLIDESLMESFPASDPSAPAVAREADNGASIQSGSVTMSVEWQGDHKLLGDEKASFERELERLGLKPDNFLVEVRREPDVEGVAGQSAIRYTVFISDVAHPERETCKLHGGHGKDWIGRYGKIVAGNR